MTPTRPVLPILIVITFLNTVGIGIIIPVLPFLIEQFIGVGSDKIALYSGLIISLYALCEFLVAPTLGALSDRYGRRPILLFSLLGSVIGYIFLGASGVLWMLFVGRIIDGLTAGNISTIFAYVADITEPKDRGKNYGIIGGTLGLGFMIGPALGGFLSHFGLHAPLWAAALVTFVSLIWAYFALPETHIVDKNASTEHHSLSPLSSFLQIKTNKFLVQVLIAGVFFFLAFAMLQGNGTNLFKDSLSWNPDSIGLIFLFIGAIDIVIQGGLTDILTKRFGERKLIVLGLILCAVGFGLFGLLPIFAFGWLAYLAAFFFSVGSGFFEPAMASTVSQSANGKNQGLVQGAYQSLQSLTRVIGPLLAAAIYAYNPANPYVLSVILAVLSVVFFVRLYRAKQLI